MVGNESTFYRPETVNQLRHYLNPIPEDFEICFKVWKELTIPTYAKQACYDPKAGQSNPRFLDAKFFNDLVLAPYVCRNPLEGLPLLSTAGLWPALSSPSTEG